MSFSQPSVLGTEIETDEIADGAVINSKVGTNAGILGSKFASVAGDGVLKLELLDNHVATGTESTYTFTPAAALNLATKYREIIVVISGKTTAAFTLAAIINGLTDYDYNTIDVDDGTVSGLQVNAGGSFELINTTLSANGDTFWCILRIMLVEHNGTSHFVFQANGGYPWHGFQVGNGEAPTNIADQELDSINVATSTSTWVLGFEMSTYGVLR